MPTRKPHKKKDKKLVVDSVTYWWMVRQPRIHNTRIHNTHHLCYITTDGQMPQLSQSARRYSLGSESKERRGGKVYEKKKWKGESRIAEEIHRRYASKRYD